MNKKGFHITIIDNDLEENNVLLDVDTCAIIAGIDEGDTTRGICYTACNAGDLAATLFSAQSVIDKNKRESELVATLFDMIARDHAKIESNEQ